MLAQNSGLDPQDVIVKLQVRAELYYSRCVWIEGGHCNQGAQWNSSFERANILECANSCLVTIAVLWALNVPSLSSVQEEYTSSKQLVGVDLTTGEALIAADEGIWDNYCVKKQLLNSWYAGYVVMETPSHDKWAGSK